MDHSCDRWLSDGNLAYLGSPLYAVSIRGQLGVVLFFVISGYCITAAAWSALFSKKSIWRYCYERIRRIYPPYLVALILSVLATASINFAAHHHLIGPVHHPQTYPISFKFWLANLFLIQSELDMPMVNIVFWSLCYEIAFYFVIGLLLKASQYIYARNPRLGILAFIYSMGATTAVALLRLIISAKAPFPFDLWHQFAIGGLLFFLLELRPNTVHDYGAVRLAKSINISTAIALTIVLSASRQNEYLDIGHPSTRVRCWTTLFFCLLLVALKPIDSRLSEHWLFKPLMWVGAFSYSLYLVHPIVIPFVDILSRKAGLTGSYYWIAFWLQTISAIVCGRLAYLLVERHCLSKRQTQRLLAERVA
jgi:peptidoglycan/LPS O-acetylase OafA/YrhL